MTLERTASAKPVYFLGERYKESFIAELQAFLQAILKDKETPVSGMDGLMPVKMGLAAKKSFVEKRAVKLTELSSS